MARDYRKLEVFHTADALLLDVLAVLATLQGPARFAFCNQLSRAALSVPLNLVEGCQRASTVEYGRFIEIAAGSAAETRYLLSVVCRSGHDSARMTSLERDYERLTQRLHVLHASITSLASHERASRPSRPRRKP